jgi:hypothetical protein
MIYPKRLLIDYIKAKGGAAKYAETTGLHVDSVKALIRKEGVGAKIIEAVLTESGFEFEGVFEVRE